MRTARLSLLILALLVPASAVAQRGAARPPRRPRLPDNGDTNSAATYASFGSSRLFRAPEEAAAAYYWASRLDPSNADAIYGRRAALLLADRQLLRIFLERDWRRRTPDQIRFIDSLQLRALRLDPFVREDVESELISHYVENLVTDEMRMQGGQQPSGTEVRYAVQNWLHDADPWIRARFAYCEGRFTDAARTWADMLRSDRRNSWLHAERARAFYHLGALDSARAEMTTALQMVRTAGADSIRIFYESKAMWEFALARILAGMGDTQAAQEAYERAVVEDITWFPAHLDLGWINLRRADTAAAMREFARAVDAAEDEYMPRMTYGRMLVMRGVYDSAAIHLQRATEIEPLAAEPFVLLGVALDQQGDTAQAANAYTAFVTRARRDDPRLERIRGRLHQLRP